MRKRAALSWALATVFAAGMFVNGIAAGEESGKPPKPAEKGQPIKPLDDLPLVIFDDSAGDWVVDRFAGNSAAGSRFYQGPAREVGGLQRPGGCMATPDGTVYISCGLPGATVRKLVKVTPDGVLRLVMETDGLIEGPMEQCQSGGPIWNPKEKALYLRGPNCLRKVVEKPDGARWVKVVAGIPNKAGKQDGPAKKATFSAQCKGIVCNSRGTFFWLEGIPYGGRLRRIENGIVSTVPLKFMEKPKRFNFAMAGGLSLGENDDTLYISDFYNQPKRILKCDLKTGELTRVCGGSKLKCKQPRSNRIVNRAGLEADGPALTHAGSNSGITGRYDPFYNALWVWGPDHLRFRWLRLDGDGWVRTAFGATRPGTKRQPFGIKELNAAGIPGEQFRFYLCGIAGIDSKGGVFIGGWMDQSGIWRAYNRKEVKP